MWWSLPFLACLGVGHRTGDPRPGLSGPERIEVSADGSFALHYTLEGDDAVAGELAADGVPELVHEAVDALVFGAQTFEERGYRTLIADGGDGGSDALDVYLRDLDINGYAHPIDGGADGASCFMELDNALTVPGVMRSVSIHELHHCVEYRYTTGTSSWVYEATATFEQYSAFLDPTLQAAVIVLWQRRLQEPGTPMDRADGSFEYAGMVPMLFWEQYRGFDALRLPALWEALALDPGWKTAFDAEAQRQWGQSWDEVFLEYATWNAFACANDDGQHYDDAVLGCNDVVSVPIEGLTWEGDAVRFDVRLPETQYTARTFEIEDAFPDRAVRVDCGDSNKKTASLLHQLVAVDPDGRAGQADSGPAGSGEAPVFVDGGRTPGGTLRLIEASVGAGSVKAVCQLSLMPEPSEAGGCGCSADPVPGPGWLGLLWLAVARRRRTP